MNGPALIRHHGIVLAPIEATARTVRVGDVLVIGSADRTVRDMRRMSGDRRHVLFTEGGSHIIGPGPVLVFRPQTPPQLVPRPSGRRR
ncbi:hypothetical protein [Streptomyces daliensis]|uniref:Uncharacterized protein n=1 Tax=Streptomyces daliensis TaxID=299421 RepID=A0A8T4IRG5_9ACTN|nr:hypothetical protein [Streptomyces daliensis]